MRGERVEGALLWVALLLSPVLPTPWGILLFEILLALSLVWRLYRKDLKPWDPLSGRAFLSFALVALLLVPAAAFKGQALIFAFTLLLPLFASQLPLEWEWGRWPLLLIALATPLTMFFLGQGEASFLYHGHGSLLGLVLLLGVVAWRERPSVAALFLPGLLLTQSKSVYLALLLGGGWLLLSWVKGRFSRKVIVLSALVALAVVALLGWLSLRSFQGDPFRFGRVEIAKTAVKMGVAHIPWGVGGFNYQGFTDQYSRTLLPEESLLPLYREYLSGRRSLQVRLFKRSSDPHNLFLQLFAELGLPGIFLGLVLIFLTVRAFRRGSPSDCLFLLFSLPFLLFQNITFSFPFWIPWGRTLTRGEREGPRPKVFPLALLLLFYCSLASLAPALGESRFSSFGFSREAVRVRETLAEWNRQGDPRLLRRAENAVKSASLLNPCWPEGYRALCLSFSALGREGELFRQKARFYREKALALSPADPFLLTEGGKRELSWGDPSSGERLLLQALRAEPYYRPALSALAEVWESRGRREEAKILRSVVGKAVNERESYRFRGGSGYERRVINDGA